jgi:hypothetical protein
MNVFALGLAGVEGGAHVLKRGCLVPVPRICMIARSRAFMPALSLTLCTHAAEVPLNVDILGCCSERSSGTPTMPAAPIVSLSTALLARCRRPRGGTL